MQLVCHAHNAQHMARATQGSVVRHHSRLPASQRACAKRLRAQAFFQFRNQAGGAPAQKGRGNKEAGQGEETGDVPPEERGKDNVKQKLDPLTSTDESKRTVGSGLLPFDEQETDEVRFQLTYVSLVVAGAVPELFFSGETAFSSCLWWLIMV